MNVTPLQDSFISIIKTLSLIFKQYYFSPTLYDLTSPFANCMFVNPKQNKNVIYTLQYFEDQTMKLHIKFTMEFSVTYVN